MAKELIGNDWDQVLDPVFASEKYHELHNFLKEEYSTKQIYPDMYHIFTAFKLTPFAKTKVVILGQDPYPSPRVFRHGRIGCLELSMQEMKQGQQNPWCIQVDTSDH